MIKIYKARILKSEIGIFISSGAYSQEMKNFGQNDPYTIAYPAAITCMTAHVYCTQYDRYTYGVMCMVLVSKFFECTCECEYESQKYSVLYTTLIRINL